MKRSKSLSYKGKRHVPLPTGQYTVGCTDIMTGSKCGVFFRLYYPAEQTGDREHFREWPLWVPSRQYVDGYARRMGVCKELSRLYFSLFIGDIYIPALWNATVSKYEAKFPVIVFSHGLGALRTAYSTICLELASHGFVVAAVEHRDHSAAASPYLKQARMSAYGQFPGSDLADVNEVLDRLSESEWNSALIDEWDPKPTPQCIGPPSYVKEWIYYHKVNKKDEQCWRKNQLIKRAQECMQAFDCLESLNNGNLINVLDPNRMESQFLGRLDLTKAAIAGHSFGGATVILTLGMEPRFRVGIALDPWMLPFFEDQSAFEFVTQPLLTVNTSTFQDDHCLDVMRGLITESSERIFLSIKKAEHKDQSDFPFVSCSLFSSIPGMHSDKFDVADISAQLSLEFLEKHLGIKVMSHTQSQRDWCKSKCKTVF